MNYRVREIDRKRVKRYVAVAVALAAVVVVVSVLFTRFALT